MQCSKCGAPVYPGAGSCPRCGTHLTYAEQAQEVAYVEYVSPPRLKETVLDSAVVPVGPARSGAAQTPPGATPAQSVGPERRYSPITLALFVTLLLLLVLGSCGITYYTSVTRPAELHSQATAVAQTILTTQAQGTAQAATQATATTAALTPAQLYTRATSGTPVINDPLNSTETGIWYHTTGGNHSCQYLNGAYHIEPPVAGGSMSCSSYDAFFKNLAFQVQMTIVTPGLGGLVFDIQTSGGTGSEYIFGVASTSAYLLTLQKTGGSTNLLSGTSTAIDTGFDQTNLLTVVAFAGQIYIYANRQLLGHFAGSPLTRGQIALFAESLPNSTTNITFKNVQVWSL